MSNKVLPPTAPVSAVVEFGRQALDPLIAGDIYGQSQADARS